MQIDSFNELLNKKEELHEDLLPCLDYDSCSFPVLRHPLIYDVPYNPASNALINKRYEERNKSALKYYEEKRYSSYVFAHERPHRLQAFLEIQKELNDKEYWELVCDIWTDSENIWQNIKIWKNLLVQRKETMVLFMSDDDKKVFDGLPESITIYRGYVEGKNKIGLSYTLDEDKAKWFSHRYGKKGNVVKRVVAKKDIFAYTNSRSEKEIIILK